MKIIKFLRTPYISMILAVLVLYTSCNQYDSPLQEDARAFDYSQYNSAKELMEEKDYLSFDKKTLSHSNLNDITETEKTELLDVINKPFKENPIVQMEVLDYFYNSGEEIFEKGIKENTLTIKDEELISSFASDMVNMDFNKAIKNLEQNVLSLKITDLEFEKYNKFINQMLIVNRAVIDDVDEGPGWACAFAIASYTLATVAVGAACTPNPTSPIACPLAIARAVAAYGSMIAACSD